MKRIKRITVFCGCVLFFHILGCSSVELEERNFPLVIGVDKKQEGYHISMGFQDLSKVADEKAKDAGNMPVQGEGKSLHGAFLDSDEGGPKSIDYNHVKALILSREILNDKVRLGEFLDYVNRQELLARNTLLFTCEKQASDVTALEGKLDLAVGTYLEEISGSSKEVKDVAVVTLGSILNEYENRMENLFIPVISIKDEKPVVESYDILSAFKSLGNIDSEVYMLAMLVEGKLDEYAFELDSGEALILANVKNSYKYEIEDSMPKVTTRVSGEARLVNGSVADENEQQELKARIEEYFLQNVETVAEKMLGEAQFDITNSYYRLGGYNRALYAKYGGDREAYTADLKTDFQFDIQPVLEQWK